MNTKTPYRIHHLKPNLVLIQWLHTPPDRSPEIKSWLDELRTIVYHAEAPVYFISDLRAGRVTDVNALFELSILSKHNNWAAGVSFSQSISSEVYVGLFARFSKREQPLADSLEAALRMLEEQHPGLTADIQWATVLPADSAD